MLDLKSKCQLLLWNSIAADFLELCRDEAQLAKLQQLGLTSTEEVKLSAMRDYMLKLGRAISRSVIRACPVEDSELMPGSYRAASRPESVWRLSLTRSKSSPQ